MDKYFFSKENVDKLSIYLGKNLNIKDTPESKIACRKFMENQMRIIYDKYGNKRPERIPVPEFIKKLNQKSVEECMKLYQAKTKKPQPSPYKSGGNISLMRDQEINQNRNTMMPNRPAHTSKVNNTNSGLPGMMDGGNFASFSNQIGGYITATGEMGDQMPMADEDGGQFSGSKRDSIDEIERRMLERQNEYEGRPNMMMNNFMNMPSYGGGNGMMNRNKPPEINFALDGGDSRRNKERQQMVNNAGNLDSISMGGDFAFAGDMGMMNNFSNFNQQSMMPNMQQQMMMPNMMGNQQQQPMMMPNMQPQMIMPNMINNQQQQQMMMPNMMNNQQQPMMMPQQQMMNNNNNNLSATSMNENEFKSKLNSIMADRNSVMNINKGPPKKFNPMISPHQNNNNNFNNGNFSKGGRVGNLQTNGDIPDFSNMSTDDIQNYIISTKKDIASSFGVDLKKLQNMSSKEISNLINNIKNPVNNNKDSSFQESKINNEIKKTKIKKEKALSDLKDQELRENAKHFSSKQIYKINSEDISKPEYYNDYLFELPKTIENISSIELLSHEIPDPLTPVTDKNNQLLIILNKEEKNIELDTGKYTIEEILEGIQSAFDQENIEITITENNGYITLKGKDNFIIDNTNNSLAKLFGFTKSQYKNDNEYTSEIKHSLVSKLYIYIDTINKEKFMFMIDFIDKDKSILVHKFKKYISEVSALIIKFKRSITEDDDLYDFNNEPHVLKIKIN